MFFESDYEGLQAEHVKSALESDPRLVLLDSKEIQESPVAKLAAKYGLVASNCSSYVSTWSQLKSNFCFQLQQKT